MVTLFSMWRRFLSRHYYDGDDIYLPVRKHRKDGTALSRRSKFVDREGLHNDPFSLVPKELTAPLPEGLVVMLREVITNNIIRSRLGTLVGLPGVEDKFRSYLFGVYLASLGNVDEFSLVPINSRIPLLNEFLELPKTFSLTSFYDLNPLIVLLGFSESCPSRKIDGSSLVIDNYPFIKQLFIDNDWSYLEAGNVLVVNDVYHLLGGISDYSLWLFLDVDKIIADVFAIISKAYAFKENIIELGDFVRFFPGVIFWKNMKGNYELKDYKSWDLRSFIKGRQGEGEAFLKLHETMKQLINTIGLYENEYDTAHVLIGSKHYDIPILSQDLQYILHITYGLPAPVDQPKYRVWDPQTRTLKKKLSDFFDKKYREVMK